MFAIFGTMRIQRFILLIAVSISMLMSAQPVQQQHQWEWYLGEVINDVFVGRNYFEYYYTPSAADMEQQRSRGEVSYFLNTPADLNVSKVRSMIDQIMASYEDIKPVNNWQITSTTCWKEFRYEKNKFRFTVKRKKLDDGTYYVSATETASYYKSLGDKNRSTEAKKDTEPTEGSSDDKPSKYSTRSRRAITQEDLETAGKVQPIDDIASQEDVTTPVVSEKERRNAERKRQEAIRHEQRLAERRAQEQQREEARKHKEAEKLKKEKEKQKKAEEKRLKKEEEQRQREQERLEREQAREAQRKQAKADKSNYHYSDVALWLSEKYDFTQIAAGENTCTMTSTAIKEVEMAKLAIKNALKGSNARMAVPWRLNNETQAIETGYTVDGHVLVFVIAQDEQQRVTLTITEVSNEQFEIFKQQQFQP